MTLAAIIVASALAGFLVGMGTHWRAWRDIFRTRRWLKHGRRIARQFDRLRDYRERFIDPRAARLAELSEDELSKLEADAEAEWWQRASTETQRQADEWSADRP